MFVAGLEPELGAAMGMGRRSYWARARFAAVAVGTILALLIPGIALAANTASFSSRTPGSGKTTSYVRPTISVKVYDPYGVKRSGITMTVDGVAVTPTVVYYTSGTFDPAHPDYRRPKISYKPATALAAGVHKVYVKVKDRKAHTSTTTWYFRVAGPEPDYSASFSSAKPVDSSTVYVTQPSVSVHVYDKYGVSGSSNYSISVDGVKLTTKVKYTTSGSYKSLDLSAKPASPLALGVHSVTATVKDLHNHSTTKTWSFTVAPEPPYSATFSALAPANAGSTLATRPVISVRVADKYGISGAGKYGLTVDGAAVTPTIKYTTAGSYLDLTLTYKPAVALSAGSHDITATVVDLHGITSSAAWSFVVSAPPEPLLEMPVTIESSSCSACHTGYPTQHPMTSCQLCHGTGRPVSGPVYTSSSTSAHTLSCSVMAPCHRGPGLTFSHVLWSDCSSCHDGQYSGIPVEHGAPDASVHLSSNTYCTRAGCHQASLTIEHYRHSVGGVKLSCATCHNSDDAVVDATIASGSTDCIGCHAAVGTTHKDLATAHAPAALSCTVSGCHDASLPATHKGACAPCHAGSTAPSAVCTNCHSLDIHASLVSQHTAPAQMCTAATCHGTNGMQIHMPRGALACQSCHAVDRTRSLICTTCHTVGYDMLHYAGNGPHPVANECTVAGCHATGDSLTIGDVGVIHTTGRTKPGCTACHKRDAASVECLDCHKRHSDLPQHKVADACATCHGADLSVIHTTGPKHPGCLVCHGPSGTLTAVCSTTGCHGGAVLASHGSHDSTVTAGNITINSADYGMHTCSDCHTNLELQAIHGGSSSCAKCHPSPASTARDKDFTCSQGGCHTADSGNMKKMHGAIDTKHIAVLPSGWSCTTGTCHGGTNDVAKIHEPKLGCATCHGGGKTPTLACQTAGCHAEGAPSSHDGHPVPETTGTVSILGSDYANVNCVTCHATRELQAIHGGGTSCVKCHPAPRNTFTDWAGGCVQGGCHTAGSTKPIHPTIDADHAPASGFAVTCGGADCHGTITSIAALHASGPGCAACHDNPKHGPSSVCSDCHGAHDFAASHAASPASETIDIDGADYGKHECSECHTPLDLRDLHGNACSTCHAPVRTKLDGDWAGGCVQGGCHSGDSTKPMHLNRTTAHLAGAAAPCTVSGCHAGGINVAAIHEPKLGCATCHGGSKVPTLDCATSGCHPTGRPASHESHDSTVTAGNITINAFDYGTHTCSDCHTSLELQAIHGGSSSCAKCHPSPASTARDKDFSCSQGGCHTADSGNMKKMHGNADGAHTLSSAPSCTSDSACHAGGTDIAKIHGVPRGPGCVACHGGGKVPTTDCATVGCHPAAITAKHDSHPATVSTITISINTVDYGTFACTTCHTSMDLPKISKHTTCSVCHPNPRSSVVGAWDGNCQTAGCHTADSGNMKLQHGAIDSAHTLSSAPSCTSDSACHAGGTDIAAIHKPKFACATCHGGGKTPTAVCATAGCHDDIVGDRPANHVSVHNVDRTKDSCAGASCHAASLDNLTAIHTTGCSTCHATDASTMVKSAIASHDTRCATCHSDAHEVSHQWCTDCHNDLGNFTYGEHGANPQPDQACANCHGSTFQPLDGGVWVSTSAHTGTCDNPDCHHGESFGAPSGDLHTVTRNDTCAAPACHGSSATNLTTIHAKDGCAACHGATAPQAAKDAIAAGNKSCADCHGFTDHVSQHVVIRNDSCVGSSCHPSTLTNLMTIHVGGCVTCHADTVRQTVKDAIASRDKTCATCHSNAHAASHQWCTNCHSDLGDFTYGEHGANPQPDQACSNCHGTTFQSLDGGSWVSTSAHLAGCDNPDCHHGESFPAASGDLHSVVRTDSCAGAGCHPASLTNLTTIHVGGCVTCHADTVRQTVKNAIAAHDKTCATCHAGALPLTHTSHDSTVTAGNITINSADYGTHTCSDCHSPLELQTLHGEDGSNNSCAKCHPSPASTARDKDFTCSQGGCHTADSGNMKKMHGAIDAKHIAVLPSGWSCTTGTCHGGTNDVAKIHEPKLGCATCHGGGKTPTLACQTAGCHATGAPSTHDSHDSTVTAGNITINTVDCGTHACSECHGGLDLQVIHGGSSSCTKCHPTPAAGATNGFTCNQSGCHSGTLQGAAVAQHANVSTAHNGTMPSGWTCTASGCHAGGTGTADVAKIHAVTNGGPGCVCHQSGHTVTLNCQTADCHQGGAPTSHGSHESTVTAASMTINGTSYGSHNCSECHASVELQTVHGGASSCTKCHPSPANTANAGTYYACTQTGCHLVASGNMEVKHDEANGIHVSFAVNGCTVAGCHSGGSDVALIHNVAKTPAKCATCHHASVLPSATGTCTTTGCHSATDSVNAATKIHANMGGGHDTGTWNGCNGCHASCSECHGDDTRGTDLASYHSGVKYTVNYGWQRPGYSTNSCLTCHTPGTTAIVDCNICHQISEMDSSYSGM